MSSMRHIVCVFALIWMALAGCPPLAEAQTGGLRYTVVVGEFSNQSNWDGQFDLGHDLGIVLTDLLQQSERFIVVGEAKMQAGALEQQDIAASGRAAGGSRSPATGQLTPAQLIVQGAITHVQYDTAKKSAGIGVAGIRVGGGKRKAEINITFAMIDSSTGQVVSSRSFTGVSKKRSFRLNVRRQGVETNLSSENDDNLMNALSEAAAQAVEWMASRLDSLPWQGSVAAIEGGEIYVNRGSREGMAMGAELVVGPLKVIRDPSTGEVLAQVLEREVARLEIASIQEKVSICRVMSGDVRAIRVGLPVTLPGHR